MTFPVASRDVAVVHGDAGLARVLGLPRRRPASPELVEALSRVLRVDPNGTALLRQCQADTLNEAWDYRGAFCPQQVGAGKSLSTMALPTLLRSARPVLMIPASLREKTRRDFVRYRQDWQVRLPELVSYQEMGRPDREDLLFRKLPDLLILDEAHHVRNRDAAVTRRIDRYISVMEAGGLRPIVVALSGTLLSENLLDYWHIIRWCLGDRAPVPTRHADAERWAQALDRDLGILHRIPGGALDDIPGGFHEWLRNSRGVIPTFGSDCSASILLSVWRPETPPELQRVIDEVTRSSLRPDDELLDEWELPDCLAQLALGFWYRWDPAPPDWWLDPRRAWRYYVRDVLDAHLDGFDSESQIVSALDRDSTPTSYNVIAASEGRNPWTEAPVPPNADTGRARLAAWRAVREHFTPNTVPVWITDSVLRQAADHARRTPTLVWTRYRAAGFKLAELGIPYFPGGTDPDGQRNSIALSISAHGTGRNLQHYSRALYLTLMANADAWEQGIGRMHRAGQRSDTVNIDVIGSIPYHGATLAKVLTQARAIEKAAGFTPKLCLADWV